MIRVVDLAMVAPFRTPFGVVESREVVIVELGIDDRSYLGGCAPLRSARPALTTRGASVRYWNITPSSRPR